MSPAESTPGPDSELISDEEWLETRGQLDYEGRDIRIIFPEKLIQLDGSGWTDPAVYGDFDPNPDDPDPDVWPLPHYDIGPQRPVGELIRMVRADPAPHVAWLTPEHVERVFGLHRVDSDPRFQRQGKTRNEPSMTLTEDRVKFFRRLAHLWNGEVVREQHLLADEIPDWNSLFGDLDQDELDPIKTGLGPTDRVTKAFGDMPWFHDPSTPFVKPVHVLRKKSKYAPTMKGRTLINDNEAFPSLRGDPNEGLTHRISVGLLVLSRYLRGEDIWTYTKVGSNIVDVVTRDPESGQRIFAEIITDHNNWKRHRETYEKLAELDDEGIPIAVFDSRTTAYKVLNHWHRSDLGTLPNGTFSSNPRIDWGREKITEAYNDTDTDWKIFDWFTSTYLWRHLSNDDQKIDRELITSIDW